MKKLSSSCALLVLVTSIFQSADTAAVEARDATGYPLLGNSLEDFYEAAIKYNPSLQIAQESFKIGEARRQQAKGQLLPQVGANANISNNVRNYFDQFGNPLQNDFNGERYSAAVTQILFNWQAFSAKKQADEVKNQLEAEYYYQLGMILTDISEKYLSVLQAQDALTSIESELNSVLNQLTLIQTRYGLELAQITDLRQAEASLSAVQAEKVKLQADLAIAEEALRSTAGIEVGPLNRLRDDIDPPEINGTLDFWIAFGRENSQRIKASEYGLLAAQEGVSGSRGAYLPQVSLIAQRQESNVGFDNIFLGDTDTTFFGVDVTIPLYSGGSNRARTSEAISQKNIAEIRLNQARLETEANIRAAFLRAESSTRLIQAAEKLVDSTQTPFEAAQRGFELGTVDNVEVLDALRNQFEAERELQFARYQKINFVLQLKREAGALKPEDLAEISRLMISPDA